MKSMERIVFFFVLMFSGVEMFAQGPPPPPPPPGLPIDSAIVALIAGAVYYGVKKLRN